MSDLIKRLRDYHNEVSYGHPICDEAADALEAKDAEIERLDGANKVLGQWVEDKDKHIERLKAALRKICSTEKRFTNHGYEIARQALEGDDER